MTEAVSGIVTVLNPVVMSFPTLFEPKKFKGEDGRESGEAKYSASFVFDADNPDFNAVKSTAIAVAKAKWPGRDIGADFKAGQFNLPFVAGNALIAERKAKLQKAGKEYDEKADFMAGKFVLKTSSKFAPRLACIENGKITADLEGAALAANKGKFYFGTKVLIQVNLVAYKGVGKTGVDGVTAYLNIVNTLNEGKRLSGGQSAAEAFSQYAGKATTENPMDDEIPF